MVMKRRDFSRHLALGGLGLAGAGSARAQAAPVEGQQFARLQPAVPPTLPSPQKKVEVVEFFSYACPHCFAFEPTMDAWVRQLPPDVYFHYVPVGFIGPALQKMFYALEAIGQREALHRKIFAAIHVQHARLNTDSEITAFVLANGVDGGKYSDALKSFAMDGKLRQGQRLVADYKVDGVPTVGVQGRYVTSPAQAGTHERTVGVLDFLIQRARQGG
jgi:thiol:disulfide interchange protein DsbA